MIGYCFAKLNGFLKKEEMEKYKGQLYCYRAPYSINLLGKEELHSNTLILVGTISSGKTVEALEEKLRNFKEMCYIKSAEGRIVFVIIRKQR